MKKLSSVLLLLLFIQAFQGCNGSSQTGLVTAGDTATNNSLPGYGWMELTANADFAKSYNFQLFTIRDTLWAFHSAGNWYSLDGKEWTKSQLSNSINNLAFLDYVYFNGAVYGLGHFEG